MSKTTASLRRKIDSAGNLQSVVRTMKALTVSSIGQYEQSVRALGDYYHTVELGLGACPAGKRAGAPDCGLTSIALARYLRIPKNVKYDQWLNITLSIW